MPKRDDKPVATSPKVKYPKVQSFICCESGDKPPITMQMMKAYLGWENEEEYRTRLLTKDPSLDPAQCRFITEDDVIKGKATEAAPVFFNDLKGRKVALWHVKHNRDISYDHCLKFKQIILQREWAGPLTMPGETVNGESFIVSRNGEVTSGQHRGVGFVLACEDWLDPEIGEKWRTNWPTMPVFETVVVRGVSDSPKVVRTLDNTKPRTLTDTIYTSDLFEGRSRSQKREASRTTAAAIDYLWDRLKAGGEKKSGRYTYQTHGTSHEWLARHPKLMKAIEFICSLNPPNARSIQISKLSPGQCAGMLYLMASNGSNAEYYHNANPPSEDFLSFPLWEKACSFWQSLVSAKEFGVVRSAISAIVSNKDITEGGTIWVERQIVLAKAWSLYKQDKLIKEKDIIPLYDEFRGDDGSGQVVLLGRRLQEWSNFGGVDLGDKEKAIGKGGSGGLSPSVEEVESAKEKESKKKEPAKQPTTSVGIVAAWKLMKEKHKDCIFLYKHREGRVFLAFESDANVLDEHCGAAVMVTTDNVRVTRQSMTDLEIVTTQLNNEGFKVAVVSTLPDGEEDIRFYSPIKPAETAV